ncbi:MAG TPA: DUF1080 domain-containing protein, partial [Fimbriimonadaceae bacterium]|nr:DUF1080 domain-containing protein [Fimbriimonadaceae bacterium]
MFALLAVGLAAAPFQTPIVTPFEAKIGFRPLFDGRTTAGWKAWRGTGVPSRWQSENGMLILKAGEGSGGDLGTVEQFGNFELRLEFRIARRGNSGIIYRAGEDYPEPWKTGPEFQVLDDFGYTGGRPTWTTTGSFYEMYAPPAMFSRPAGEWNEARIVAKGNRIEHWLNQVKVVDCTIGSNDWNARYEKSKFKEFPEFARKPRGFIVLQDHGAEVAYRRIR